MPIYNSYMNITQIGSETKITSVQQDKLSIRKFAQIAFEQIVKWEIPFDNCEYQN